MHGRKNIKCRYVGLCVCVKVCNVCMLVCYVNAGALFCLATRINTSVSFPLRSAEQRQPLF
jgi:hypothetical protein